MKIILFALTFLIASYPSQAFSKKPIPAPSASPSTTPLPSPSPTVTPSPKPGVFVMFGTDIGTSVDKEFAGDAFALMNAAYSNGCLKAGIEAHKFKSLNTVFEVSPKTNVEAAGEYLGGVPYALNVRWYYKGWPSDTIGYTYNFKNDDWNGVSETRIWSNTRFMSTEKVYAAHLAHELSHQARAGGFVHYTIFGGSFPYDVGDIMANCVKNL